MRRDFTFSALTRLAVLRVSPKSIPYSALIRHVLRDATNGSGFNVLIHFDRPPKSRR